jgi:hypothetical protein
MEIESIRYGSLNKEDTLDLKKGKKVIEEKVSVYKEEKRKALLAERDIKRKNSRKNALANTERTVINQNYNTYAKKCPSRSEFKELLEEYADKRIIKDLIPYSFIEKLFCYFTTNVKLANQINSQITELKVLNAGYQGTIYDATFNKLKNIIVLKEPKTTDSDDDIVHEFFIALMCTNKLRFRIPNFAYIYGQIYCDFPKIDDHGKIYQDWCDQYEIGIEQFLIIEKILGETLATKIKKCSVEECMSYLLQIVNALQLAETENNFTHYDLHSSNVICRDWEPNFYIKYENLPFAGQTIKVLYIKTNKIATIIDYGRASIKVGDTWFGIKDDFLEKFNHIYNKMNPDYDLFKLIGSCYNIINNDINPNVRDMLRLILLEYFKFDVKNKEIYDNEKKRKWAFPGPGRPISQFLQYLLTQEQFQSKILGKIVFKELNGDEQKKVLCLSDLCLTKL